MSSSFGHAIKVSLFGESHGPGIGVVIDGLPSGEKIDFDELRRFMARRAPGHSATAAQRREEDVPEILSGMILDTTTGTPLAAVIRNTDIRPQDYAKIQHIPRPGHADYAAELKYHGFQDRSGGGHFSGRITAPLTFAGGIALQILRGKGIHIGAHLASVGGIEDTPFDPVRVSGDELETLSRKPFPVIRDDAGEAMRKRIADIAAQKDSVGGVIECAVTGFPGGMGSPMFDGLENRLAQVLFGIPAVKGVDFGAGFRAAEMRGSEHNDAFRLHDGKVITETNRHGGILGGISTGMPILFRIAVKPAPSIAMPQNSVDLNAGTNTVLEIAGRHDPCIAPRAVPVTEAASAIVLLDILTEEHK